MFLSLNPQQFGNDDDERHCIDCGAAFTMAQFRVFAWVEASDVCVEHGAARASLVFDAVMASNRSEPRLTTGENCYLGRLLKPSELIQAYYDQVDAEPAYVVVERHKLPRYGYKGEPLPAYGIEVKPAASATTSQTRE